MTQGLSIKTRAFNRHEEPSDAAISKTNAHPTEFPNPPIPAQAQRRTIHSKRLPATPPSSRCSTLKLSQQRNAQTGYSFPPGHPSRRDGGNAGRETGCGGMGFRLRLRRKAARRGCWCLEGCGRGRALSGGEGVRGARVERARTAAVTDCWGGGAVVSFITRLRAHGRRYSRVSALICCGVVRSGSKQRHVTARSP